MDEKETDSPDKGMDLSQAAGHFCSGRRQMKNVPAFKKSSFLIHIRVRIGLVMNLTRTGVNYGRISSFDLLY
jgi:hypothetical protein